MDPTFLTNFITSPYFILVILFTVFGYMLSPFGKKGMIAGGFAGLCVALVYETVPMEYTLVVMLAALMIYALIYKRR